jgi:hypothetical protein
VKSQDLIKTNQKVIVENQKFLIGNQRTILSNQKTIIKNQCIIFKNKKTLDLILKNQQSILKLLKKEWELHLFEFFFAGIRSKLLAKEENLLKKNRNLINCTNLSTFEKNCCHTASWNNTLQLVWIPNGSGLYGKQG